MSVIRLEIACGELGHFVKIVGGREARPHSYPWIAALTGFPKEGDYYCGATIISSRYDFRKKLNFEVKKFEILSI